ncbi:MAG: MBL fold metallo-hydrolase [Sulfuricella sp.]|nr:MBL fold metallo-hydrolase [Sulfuricella sp.]
MNEVIVKEYADGISAVDALYHGRVGHSAIHVVVENGHAAVIDTGTNYSIPLLIEALGQNGIAPEQVDYVIVTHVHLDHAGGAGECMRRFPNARLVVHPKGARHMIDPAKLVAGTVGVYGAEKTRQVYGEILPIAAERVIEAPDDFSVSLAGRELRFLDTPGHARHHFCVYDGQSGSVFSGDVFGLSYREFDVDGHPFVYPATTPVQLDPAELHKSIDRLMALDPRQIYLTHYSRVAELERLADDLHRRLDDFTALARGVGGAGEERHRRLMERLESYLLEKLDAHGCRLPHEKSLHILSGDADLNAQGLEVWLDKQAGV